MKTTVEKLSDCVCNAKKSAASLQIEYCKALQKIETKYKIITTIATIIAYIVGFIMGALLVGGMGNSILGG